VWVRGRFWASRNGEGGEVDDVFDLHFGLRELLDQLVADVAGFQAGEDEKVRLRAQTVERIGPVQDLGDQSGVGLNR